MSPDPRRKPRGSGPRGRTGPGRPGARPAERPDRPADRPAAPGVARAARERAAGPAARPRRPRPRLTGRAAILVFVLAVLAVSYASSAKAYLQQRSELDALHTEIAQRQASIDDLEREKRRWEDPEYVQQIARERFGYVGRGETSYVVLGEDGKPLKTESELGDPATVGEPSAPKAWWDDAWSSMQVAGDPPKNPGTPPLTEIDGSGENQEGQ